MNNIFVIEDEGHSEWLPGEFSSFEEALSVLRGLALCPWDAEPNRAPCNNWENCGRDWTIVQFDRTTAANWTELSRTAIVEVRRTGARWLYLS